MGSEEIVSRTEVNSDEWRVAQEIVRERRAGKTRGRGGRKGLFSEGSG